MKLCEYSMSRSILDLDPMLFTYEIKTCFSQKPLGQFQPSFICKLYGKIHVCAWRSPWSCDMDYLYKLSPFPKRLYVKFGFDWPSGLGEDDLWKWWTTPPTDDRRTPEDDYYTFSYIMHFRWNSENYSPNGDSNLHKHSDKTITSSTCVYSLKLCISVLLVFVPRLFSFIEVK